MARPIDDISGALAAAIAQAIVDSKDTLEAIAVAGGKAAGPGPLQDAESLVKIITSIITTLPIVGDLAGLALGPVDAIDKNTSSEGRAFGMGWIFGSVGLQLMEPVVEDVTHYVNDLIQSGIFDPATAAQLRAKSLISEDQGRSEAAGGNLDGTHFDILTDAAQERPPIGQVLDAWLKGYVNEDAVNSALQHHTIPEFWWPAIKALRRQFLSPADLALANLRGIIDDTELTAYSAQLGVTDSDMQTLIGNTGEPPGIMEMLFLLRRGLISQDDMVRAIKQSRIRNEWVPAVLDLRFAPMTTADAARAVVEGYMTVDEGAVIAEQNGLDKDHWPIIVESWGRPPSHEQMMTLYHRGQATLDQVKQAFKESDIKDKYIGQLIDLGRTLIPERLIVQALGKSVITHDAAHTALTERGYNDDDAEVLLKLGTAERAATNHALTKTDVLAMYADALLTRKQAEDHLHTLGFTPVDSDALLNLQDAKVVATNRRTVQRGVEAALKAKHITEADAVKQLMSVGIDHTQALALVQEWESQRGNPTKTLTEAQTVSAAADGIITPQDAYDRLRGLGYSQVDAIILLKLKGMPGGTALTFSG